MIQNRENHFLYFNRAKTSRKRRRKRVLEENFAKFLTAVTFHESLTKVVI